MVSKGCDDACGPKETGVLEEVFGGWGPKIQLVRHLRFVALSLNKAIYILSDAVTLECSVP
jgi:hypothetical protein